jgi:hypothetical protein
VVAGLQRGVLSVARGLTREMWAARAAAVSAIGGYGSRSNPVPGVDRMPLQEEAGCPRRRSAERGARIEPSVEGSAASEVSKGGLGFPNCLTTRRFPVQTLRRRKRGEVGNQELFVDHGQ